MNTTPKILAFAGSAREGSYNKVLVKIAAAGAEATGAQTSFVDLRDLPMPLYDADLEVKEGIPANVLHFKQIMLEHDGLLISSPENNSTVSALLKNVIDWTSRMTGDEKPLAAFDGKIAGIMSASPGALGGLRGLVHLRAILENIRVMVLPDQKAVPQAHKAFDQNGQLIDATTRRAVEHIGARLCAILARLKA